jgi:NAD(P)-dependent dehydrogenase (short-subunit alcohol dehydrogenase family)
VRDLAGRTAVVTGGASGIGLAMAERFAAEGMRIVIGDVEAEALDAAVARLAESGAEAVGIVTDVGDASAVQALADATAALGGAHVVCLTAGVGRSRPGSGSCASTCGVSCTASAASCPN